MDEKYRVVVGMMSKGRRTWLAQFPGQSKSVTLAPPSLLLSHQQERRDSVCVRKVGLGLPAATAPGVAHAEVAEGLRPPRSPGEEQKGATSGQQPPPR